MTWQTTPYTVALVLTAGATAALAYLVWRRRATPGGGPVAGLLLAAAEWSLGYALEMAAADIPSKMVWANLQYLGITAIAPLWLLFALAYTGRRLCVSRLGQVCLGLVPAITACLVWLEGDLGLMRTAAHLDTSSGFAVLVVEFGPWFWVNVAYSYALLGAGMLLLVPVVLRSPYLYRWQAGTVLLGLVAPWLGNAFYVFGFGPWPNLDLTLFGFIATGVAVSWGLFRYRFLDMVPVARDTVVEDMVDGVVAVGPHGLVADVNPAALAALGSRADAVIGRPASEVLGGLSADLGPLVDEPGTAVEVTGSRDGERRHYEVRVSAIRHRGSQRDGRLITIHDISDRKRAEEELVRTQRLRAAGELSLGVSHNLNNLLTGVLGPAELIKRMAAGGTEIRDQAELIARSALRARDLVQRLGEMARDAEGDALEPVSVQDAIVDAVAASRPRWKDEAEARGVHIELATKLDEVPTAAGSSSGLHDVLLNLIFNAVDALPGGGRIDISCTAAQESAEVRVTDTGVGMAEEVRQRVFEPFFTTKMSVGTGLGLSTAHSTVARWGGSLEVESEPGRGSTFTVRMPLWRGAEAATTDDGTDAADEPTGEAAAGQQGGGTILVAEDEAVVQVMLAEVLSRAGHQVRLAVDGDAALRALQRRRFDVAMVDLGMPGMSGDQVAAHIRDVDPAVATVLITGWSLRPDDPRLAPFDFCLQKPFDVAQVESVVARSLELTARRRRTA